MSAINNIATQHEREVTAGRRFSFGRNWASFLKRLNEARIAEAEKNLIEFLGEKSLAGRSFLDIGSGSGLSSLAARRLGATVTSFDYDGQSVACTEELRRRYVPDDSSWIIEQGSVLDTAVSHGARPIRRRLLLGCPAPHRGDVAGDGQCKNYGKDRGVVVHRHLQRLWRSQPVVAGAKTPVQLVAANTSPILRRLRLDATGAESARWLDAFGRVKDIFSGANQREQRARDELAT